MKLSSNNEPWHQRFLELLKLRFKKKKRIYFVPSTELHGGLPAEVYTVKEQPKTKWTVRQKIERYFKKIFS